MSLPRLLLLICVLVIFALGLVMIFNTSSAEVLDHSLKKSTNEALIRQILYAILGCTVAVGAYLIGYRDLLQLSTPLFLFFVGLLILTLIPGIGISVNGARRWIGVGGYTIQPSEFVKLILPFFCLHQMQCRGEEISKTKDFLKLTAAAAVAILLVLVEPNNGTAAFLGFLMVVLFLLTGVSTKYWAIPMLSVMLIGGVVAVNSPYVFARLKVYLNPELDIHGRGHQPHQAKIAAGSGGLLGKGPGKSLQKLSYLPEAQNDYIAAIYAEEFGFLGTLTLILLYMILASLGFFIAFHANDRAGFYIAAMTTFVICFQAFFNLAVVSGMLPSTGLNLPFFSQGGSSLMTNIIGIGLLLDVARKSERKLYSFTM